MHVEEISVLHVFGFSRHAVAGVVLSWVWSFIWNTPPLFGWGSFELEGLELSCAPNWYSRDYGNMSYIVIYFFLCFAVPFSIIMVSYARLLWTLRQVRRWTLYVCLFSERGDSIHVMSYQPITWQQVHQQLHNVLMNVSNKYCTFLCNTIL